jgi:SAM-dependent methyltransferase
MRPSLSDEKGYEPDMTANRITARIPTRVIWHMRRLGASYLPDTVSLDHTRREAAKYWAAEQGSTWHADSHWRSGLGEDAWREVGEDHLAMYRMFAGALGISAGPGVVLDWGCGGGANAVAFAPLATKYIAADISSQTTAECLAQVRAVCDTPSEERHIDLDLPQAATVGLEHCCDTFLCFYVLETTAGPDDALEILRIAESVLKEGGMAFVQVKYHTADPLTRGRRRRSYRRLMAQTTTFAIDEFWLRAQELGLTPRLIHLLPWNRLDSHYAYFALTKPER